MEAQAAAHRLPWRLLLSADAGRCPGAVALDGTTAPSLPTSGSGISCKKILVFIVRLIKRWHRFAREVVESLLREMLNTRSWAACCRCPCAGRAGTPSPGLLAGPSES